MLHPRHGLMFLMTGFALSACEVEPDCNDNQTLENGVCVDNPIETDTGDTGGPNVDPDLFSPVRISLDIQRIPNKTHLSLKCGEEGGEMREYIGSSNFQSKREHKLTQEILKETYCTVELWDAAGGEIPAGKVRICDVYVDEWEAERIPSDQNGGVKMASTFNVLECIDGCTDPVAENYDENATRLPHDDYCEYIDGCMDDRAINYNVAATRDDGTCDFGGYGIVEVDLAMDSEPEDTTVHLVCDGVEVRAASGFANPQVPETVSWPSDAGNDCHVEVGDLAGDLGPAGTVRVCGEAVASWEAWDLIPQGGSGGGLSLGAYRTDISGTFFIPACSGCVDPEATNFDEDAYIDDGSCTY